MIKGLRNCPTKYGLKELGLFSLERESASMLRGLNNSLQEYEGYSMSDGKQLFPVSTEDWIRKNGVKLQQVGLRTPWRESSKQQTPKTKGTSVSQNSVAS